MHVDLRGERRGRVSVLPAEKDGRTGARKGKCARDLCNDRKLTRYSGRTMQLSSTNRIYDWPEKTI